MKNNTSVTQYEKMTNTPIPKLILLLSVPSIISTLVTNIYNLADTAFVGQLGTSASGAVGIVFGFMAIIQAFGFMFGQGAGSILSRALGEKQNEKASLRNGLIFIPTLLIMESTRSLTGIQEAQPIAMLLTLPFAIAYAFIFFKKLPKTDGEE